MISLCFLFIVLSNTRQVIIWATTSVIKALMPRYRPKCVLCAIQLICQCFLLYVPGTRISSSRQQTLGGGSRQSHHIPGPEHTVSVATGLSVPSTMRVKLCSVIPFGPQGKTKSLLQQYRSLKDFIVTQLVYFVALGPQLKGTWRTINVASGLINKIR